MRKFLIAVFAVVMAGGVAEAATSRQVRSGAEVRAEHGYPESAEARRTPVRRQEPPARRVAESKQSTPKQQPTSTRVSVNAGTSHQSRGGRSSDGHFLEIGFDFLSGVLAGAGVPLDPMAGGGHPGTGQHDPDFQRGYESERRRQQHDAERAAGTAGRNDARRGVYRPYGNPGVRAAYESAWNRERSRIDRERERAERRAAEAAGRQAARQGGWGW